MAAPTPQPDASAAAKKPAATPPAATASAPRRSRVDWKAVWPVPALVVASAALVGALVMGVLRAPKADPAAPLRTAAELVEQTDYEPAVTLLNTRVAPAVEAGALTADQRREFHLLRARSIFNGQKKLGISLPENFEAVVKDYTEAQALTPGLDPQDLDNLAWCHIKLGQPELALAAIERFPETERGRRLALVRGIVEHNIRQRDVKYDLTIGLLGEILATPGLSIEDRAWALARQTDLRLATGFADEAITNLLRTLPRLDAEGLPASRRGELLFQLARAYYATNQFAPALVQVEAAEEALGQIDPLIPEVKLLGGQLLQALGRLEEARPQFDKVAKSYEGAAAALPALLGVAETASGLDDDDAAVKAYAQLLDDLPKAPPRRDLTMARVAASLMDRYADRARRERTGKALDYAMLAERAYRLTREPLPPEVILAVARSNEALATRLLADAAGPNSPTPEAGAAEPALSPVTASQVRRHALEAGGAFREHARAVLIADSNQSLASLWSAAMAFDRGGDYKSLREALQSFIDGSLEEDPRKPEARFRLAQAFQAERDYLTAASVYRQIIESRSGAAGGASARAPSAGVWADRSMVPLARCLLADADPKNDTEARTILEQVVDGSILTPASIEFRDALAELGEHLYSAGEYAQAMTRLGEALSRYPDHPRGPILRFKLADANRLSAAAIATDLQSALPQAQRQELEATRIQRLQEAAGLFQATIDALRAKNAADASSPAHSASAPDHGQASSAAAPPKPESAAGHATGQVPATPAAPTRPTPAFERGLSKLERVYLRNAMFYLGDCAFDLGDYSAAIVAYDAAAQQYATDPASLVALTQIVAAYAAQDKWPEARTANERAKRQLASLPEDVWKNPDLPMQRRHWERWFNSSMLLQRQRQDTSATIPAGE